MKKRSVSGNVAIGIAAICLITVFVAFCSPNWLVSDYRITGARLDRLGLWSHCFRSLPDPLDDYQRRFFVGCRWVYDPFTTGYDQIRGYLLPPFMIVTQIFYTLCFLAILIASVLVLLFFLCCGPEQKHFILLLKALAGLYLFAGVMGGIAVIVFASLANAKGWMPGQENNFFGWSFGLAVVSVCLALITGVLFVVELITQHKKKEYLKESQTRFELAQETKA